MAFKLQPGRRPEDGKPKRVIGKAKKPMPKRLPAVYVTPLGDQVYDWPVEKVPKVNKRNNAPMHSGGFYQQKSGDWMVGRQFSDMNLKEMRRRIALLGLTVNQFANRAGISTFALYRFTEGKIPLHLERLLQFEELLAALADALDKPQPGPGSSLRHDVAAVLMTQVRRLP